MDAPRRVGSFAGIAEVVRETLAGERAERFGDIDGPVDEVGRLLTTGPGWAYLRIAEGCDKRCAYCAIPAIRGRYRSRPAENVLAEARGIAAAGVKELIVIAQDITRLRHRPLRKADARRALPAALGVEGVEWIALHYLYPDEFDDALIEEIAANDKIVKYLDIPIQHIDDAILKRMNRRGGRGADPGPVPEAARAHPRLVLRTSLITGCPARARRNLRNSANFCGRRASCVSACFPTPGVGDACRRDDGPRRSSTPRSGEPSRSWRCSKRHHGRLFFRAGRPDAARALHRRGERHADRPQLLQTPRTWTARCILRETAPRARSRT